MKTKDIFRKQPLVEAPLTPQEFEQKRSGVKIGFEFEVCIKRESVDGPQQQQSDPATTFDVWIKERTIEQLFDRIADLRGQGETGTNPLGVIDDTFKMRRTRANQQATGSTSTGLNTAYQAFVDNKVAQFNSDSSAKTAKLIETIKKAFHDLSQITDQRIIPEAEQSKQEFIEKCERSNINIPALIADPNPTPLSETQLFAIRSAAHRQWINYGAPIDTAYGIIKSGLDISSQYNTFQSERLNYSNTKENFIRWVNDTFGTTNLGKLLEKKWALRDQFIRGRPTSVHKLYWFTTPGSNLYGAGSQQYGPYSPKMRTWLKNLISSEFGTVEVFSGYHERSKKLDRWYIEPDGSLQPNSGDYSAEIVGPPQPVDEAVRTLSTFVPLALSNGFYTNKSTGLHINISIPETLDVMKLALFSGDQWVLQKFDRMNSRYAQSIINNLRQNSHVQNIAGLSINDPDNQEELKRIASSISSDHFSSVNVTRSGYVSFRHAGGDYLNKLPDLMITLKNFVRAMIIASSPDAYREEYLQKLGRLLVSIRDTRDDEQQLDRSTIRQALAGGIPYYRIQIAIMNSAIISRSIEDDLIAALRDKGLFRHMGIAQYITIEPSGHAQQLILSPGGLRDSTKEEIENADQSKFYVASVYPANIQQVQLLQQNPPAVYASGTSFALYNINDNGARLAVCRGALHTVTQTAPAYRRILQRILAGQSPGPRAPLPESSIMNAITGS